MFSKSFFFSIADSMCNKKTGTSLEQTMKITVFSICNYIVTTRVVLSGVDFTS